MRGRRSFLRAGLLLLAGLLIMAVSWQAFVIVFVEFPSSEGGTTFLPAGMFEERDGSSPGTFGRTFYDVVVELGPALDVYLFTERDYGRYLEGSPPLDAPFPSIVHSSVRAASGSPLLPAGMYHLVIDNTDFGVADPDGETARIRFSLGFPGPPSMPPNVVLALLVGGAAALLIAGTTLTYLGYHAPLNSVPDANRIRL